MNKGTKIAIWVAVGTAVGAAIAYFADEDRRNKFVDNVNDATSRMGESLKDAYYEGRIRARRAGRDISRRFADLKDNASAALSDAAESAKHFGRKAKDAAERVAELTEEELAGLKEEALKKSAELAD